MLHVRWPKTPAGCSGLTLTGVAPATASCSQSCSWFGRFWPERSVRRVYTIRLPSGDHAAWLTEVCAVPEGSPVITVCWTRPSGDRTTTSPVAVGMASSLREDSWKEWSGSLVLETSVGLWPQKLSSSA